MASVSGAAGSAIATMTETTNAQLAMKAKSQEAQTTQAISAQQTTAVGQGCKVGNDSTTACAKQGASWLKEALGVANPG